MGQRGGEDEAAGLDPGDQIDRPGRRGEPGQRPGYLGERGAVGDQRDDVFEDDAGLREVSHVPQPVGDERGHIGAGVARW